MWLKAAWFVLAGTLIGWGLGALLAGPGGAP